MGGKLRINISIDNETDAMLREFAKEGHTTVSPWITDRVWEKVEERERSMRILEREIANKDK